jgi:DNA-binding NarL/FixJ family response regulator
MKTPVGLQQEARQTGQQPSAPLRILITDDHAGLRHRLRQILADAFPQAVFGEAGSGDETLEKLADAAWDCVLLDVSMPGKSGWRTMQSMRLTHPHLPVLALSEHAEEGYSRVALRSGANGCMPKENAPEQLAGILRQIMATRPNQKKAAPLKTVLPPSE